MHHLKKLAGMALLALALTACSSNGVTANNPQAKKESKGFIQYAQTIPPIVVPPGIPDPTGEDYYPVPHVPMKAPLGTIPPLQPPGSHLT